MTSAGKIAVFINLALGLVFAFWGVGLYTNRIDWTATKVGERQGEYAQRASRIEVLKKSLTHSLAEREIARGRVEAEEKRRPLLQARYAQLLTALRTGNGPLATLDYRKGELQVDTQGYPQVVKDPQALRSLRALNEEYEARQNEIRKVRQDIDALVKAEQALTEELIGTERPNIGGLRGALAAQQRANQKSLDEQEYLRPLLYNRQAEAQILVKRRKSLQARLKELQAVGVARQR